MTTHTKIGLSAGAIVLLVAAGIAFSQYKDNQSRSYPTSAPYETTNPGAITQTTQTTTDTASKTYTLADVAKHNDTSSCWTAVNGGVYDVTSWINQHPGGRQAILGMCGIDGSGEFNGQHGGQRRPESELASFKIGILAQ